MLKSCNFGYSKRVKVKVRVILADLRDETAVRYLNGGTVREHCVASRRVQLFQRSDKFKGCFRRDHFV